MADLHYDVNDRPLCRTPWHGVAPAPALTTDPDAVTCPLCLDWLPLVIRILTPASERP